MTSLKPTRRDILKSGCAVAAGLALPYVIPSSALGDDENLPASDRVTLAHIGVGGRGSFLLNSIHAKGHGFQSVAVADCYADRREAIAKQIGGKAYVDFREILARDDIDGVIIATPDHWHVPIAIMAARAGKDAYVEKPLGLSIEQDLVCQKVFKEQGRVFQYGTQQREAQHIQAGRRLILEGKLGKLKAIEVKAPNGGAGGSTAEAPIPAGFDYEMWLGPAPKVPYTVDRCNPQGTYWIYDQSIGYLAGWGAHPLDVLVWCYYGDQAGPYTVEGTGKIPTEGLYDTVYDWDMTLRMADGVTITFKPGSDSTKFIGTDARIELTRGSLRTYPRTLLPPDLPGNDHQNNVTNHIQCFINAIRSREETSSPIDDSVRSDVMSHLCNIAVRSGEKVTWDPRKQQLIDGSEMAQAMITRPMREPWML